MEGGACNRRWSTGASTNIHARENRPQIAGALACLKPHAKIWLGGAAE